MKILILSEFFPQGENPEFTGGVEARNYFLAKYLSRKNDVTVFCSRTSSLSNEPASRQVGLPTTDYRLVFLGFPRSYLQSGDLFKRIFFVVMCVIRGLRTDFDVCDGSNFVTHLAALILGTMKRKPIVFWYADVWIGRWIKNIGITGSLGEILERMVLSFGKKAKFIAISQYTKRNLIKNKIPEKNVTVIPLGVDDLEVESVAVSPLKKKYDLVAVNRLVKYKKTEEIIEAVNIIQKMNSYARVLTLNIIGDGPEKENLQNLINDYQLQESIKIVSGKEHKSVMRLISESKIFVSASIVEGFGIAPVEAAAFGIPCLLKNIEPYLEHENNLEGCLIFKNSNELAALIEKMLNEPQEYEKLSKNNKKNSSKFFWSKIVKDTEDLYKKY
jgi:glycosyltransferase involved in cell wall biosynthesis